MWRDRINVLDKKRNRILQAGGADRIEKQHKSGKLTARERIDMLFDPGTFVEVDSFIESRIDDFGLDKKRVPGDGVVTGYGEINGRTVFVSSEDFTVIGGSLGEYHSMKIARIQDMAYDMKAPIIMINDSGGARIEEGIDSLSGYANIFLRNTKASGVIPQIAVIVGPCSGGACYSPAICDYIFMVDDISKMFITGPQVVKTVVNEECTVEELGGAKVHATKSGVTHFTYQDETSCFEGVKQLLSYLPGSYLEKPPVKELVDETNGKKSLLYALNTLVRGKKMDTQDYCGELVDIVPDNSRKAYDVLEVIERICDKDSFLEVQKDFAKNIVVGYARINGESVGIVANQPMVLAGSLDYDASDKAARFIRTCDCYNVPLVVLVDVPAFMPGTAQEHKGIIRHGAKMLYAFSEATVPKISVIMRKAYGGAYIAMNSKNMGADLVYAWPGAEIAVMGAEGAVNIAFRRAINESEDKEATRAQLVQEYKDKFMNPYVAASRGFVTEVIRPDETRSRLKAALKMLKNKQVAPVPKKHGNIPL
ncbi:acyl-CoA carboxylase subunit beta [Clostridiaceae bacterium AF31-3BH]|nr:acyl-CoA carboxylase subunit beta [Clostridiaceae bacterium AF31-3BH]